MIIAKPTKDETILCQSTNSVFLAGSIEMGNAPDWQTVATDMFKRSGVVDVVCNPRRDDWDSNWEQKFTNPQFFTQVNWELDHIAACSIVLFYFAPGTQSPISLLELGLCANTSDLVVVCPEGFWRKGNVDIVCSRNDIPLYESLESAVSDVVAWFISG